MLCYLACGPRDYARKPVTCYPRVYWEFQAVTSGRIARTTPDGADPLRARRLWISAPGHPHGWTGERGRGASVAVFHFLRIPEPLARLVRDRGVLEIPLNSQQTGRLRGLAREKRLVTPGPDMLLRQEHALLELCLMAFEAHPPAEAGGHPARLRVQKALEWFAAHLPENPGLEEIAAAAGSSPANLRRHFLDVFQDSPKPIFDQMRFQRALHLMADPGAKLGAVAEACGFESPSAFSRAFKAKFGVSPDRWRGRKESPAVPKPGFSRSHLSGRVTP